jgi:Protein of unknown function (DUF3102)
LYQWGLLNLIRAVMGIHNRFNLLVKCSSRSWGAVVMSDLPIHADRLPSIAGNPASAVQGVRRFDYGSLPLEKAQALRESRTRIHTEIKKTAESVIAIGRELIVVKKTLPHGAFQAWVSSECGVSLRSAQNYMRVARLADKNATVAFLPLGTLYCLGGPANLAMDAQRRC